MGDEFDDDANQIGLSTVSEQGDIDVVSRMSEASKGLATCHEGSVSVYSLAAEGKITSLRGVHVSDDRCDDTFIQSTVVGASHSSMFMQGRLSDAGRFGSIRSPRYVREMYAGSRLEEEGESSRTCGLQSPHASKSLKVTVVRPEQGHGMVSGVTFGSSYEAGQRELVSDIYGH